MSIEISDKDDLMLLVFRLTRMEMQYPEFAKRRAEYLCNTMIVDRIRERMERKGYSKKISERVRAEFVGITPDGVIEFDIVSDFKTNEGFDVAKMMDEGRKEYWDAPRYKKALHWITEGINRFSRGHWIPKRPGDRYVSQTILEYEQMVQDSLDAETDAFIGRQLSE